MAFKIAFSFSLVLVFCFVSCSTKEPDPAKNSGKKINTFAFNSFSPVINGSIDTVQRIITATLPIGTDPGSLVPTVTLSDKATVVPATGVAQNFSKPVVYTVTAEDGTTQTYTVKTTVAKSTAKTINSFTINTSSGAVTATIDYVKKTITAVLPAGTDLKKLTPTIRFSERASLWPASVVPQDFSRPVEYTVTAEDGSNQTFISTIVTINDQSIQGRNSLTKTFLPKTIQCKSDVFFGESGYNFKLYDVDMPCSTNTFPPVYFFISKLEPGVFQGQGPYFFDASNGMSTSFFGCVVVISKVTATTVEGSVKGGNILDDKYGDKYIEGKFTATICK